VVCRLVGAGRRLGLYTSLYGSQRETHVAADVQNITTAVGSDRGAVVLMSLDLPSTVLPRTSLKVSKAWATYHVYPQDVATYEAIPYV